MGCSLLLSFASISAPLTNNIFAKSNLPHWLSIRLNLCGQKTIREKEDIESKDITGSSPIILLSVIIDILFYSFDQSKQIKYTSDTGISTEHVWSIIIQKYNIF